MEKVQQYKLKELAHNTIAAELGVEELKDWKFNEPEFKENRGVFVTLEIEGQLRGCIGNIEPICPLWEAVQKNAFAAAFEDPRFDSLDEEEFEMIDIEISILSLPKASTIDDVRPGVDGVVIKQGVYSATYLPQVWEDLPDKDNFMSSLCEKGGMSSSAWKNEEVEVFTYQVEKF